MSRQIQIRRGTKNQHASFTGAIGEVTMDTTNKTLRVHDGVTVGGNEMLSRNSFYSYITNCITEIPQDIKLELNNGILTLKAGSKIYRPNGTYSVVDIDKTLTNTWGGAASGMVFYQAPHYAFFPFERIHSGTTNPSALTGNSHINFNTTDNKIYVTIDRGQTWNTNDYVGLPLACVTWDVDNKITSIDQVFNGFGYMGSTIFALPGVRGLIPNGRNEDGTLKNISMYNQIVRTVTRTSSGKRTMALASGGYFESFTSLNYDAETNFVYSTDGTLRQFVSVLETESDANTKVISFNPKKVFSFIS